MSFNNNNDKNSCEIGSYEMPPLEWLLTTVATFQQNYGQIHPYFAVGLCITGTLMNLVTILVLTRPSMRSPVNVLLCAVACCDIIVEVSYLMFVLHFLLASADRCEPSDFSWCWAVFMMFHAHASVIFHAASIWMLVVMAQLRVLTIRRATKGPTTPLITERFTALIALLTTLTMIIVNIPNFLTFEIVEENVSVILPCWQQPTITTTTSIPSQKELFNFNITTTNLTNKIRKHKLKRFQRSIETTNYYNNLTESSFLFNNEPKVYTVRAHESDCMNLKLAFWTNGILFKVIPCILLSISIAALLRIIADVAHKRKNLAKIMRKKVPKDHTTPMLAAILTIFLFTELPQGLLLVLNGIFSSESFHKRLYLPLGDLMDILSLLNSAVGFIIYVGMSRKFRTVFLQIFFTFLRFIFRAELCLSSLRFPMLKRTLLRNNNDQIKLKSKNNGSGGVIVVQQSLKKLEQRLAQEFEFSEVLENLVDNKNYKCSQLKPSKIPFRQYSSPHSLVYAMSEKSKYFNSKFNKENNNNREPLKLRSYSTISNCHQSSFYSKNISQNYFQNGVITKTLALPKIKMIEEKDYKTDRI